jgi:hypothetical protein
VRENTFTLPIAAALLERLKQNDDSAANRREQNIQKTFDLRLTGDARSVEMIEHRFIV